MKKLLLVLVAFLLESCANMSYQEPASGPRARVRFATTTEAISVLRVYEDKNCSINETEWMRLRNGVLMNSAPKRLGIPLWHHHENGAKEVQVKAEVPTHGMFTGSVSYGARTLRCGVPFSYTFEANRDYEVEFRVSVRKCTVGISEITSNASAVKINEVASFDNRITDENRGCLDQFKKTRLY